VCLSVQPDPRKLSSIFVALDFFVTSAFIRTALMTRAERTGESLRTQCLVVTARGEDEGRKGTNVSLEEACVKRKISR
jgi:hypothetical protein